MLPRVGQRRIAQRRLQHDPGRKQGRSKPHLKQVDLPAPLDQPVEAQPERVRARFHHFYGEFLGLAAGPLRRATQAQRAKLERHIRRGAHQDLIEAQILRPKGRLDKQRNLLRRTQARKDPEVQFALKLLGDRRIEVQANGV